MIEAKIIKFFRRIKMPENEDKIIFKKDKIYEKAKNKKFTCLTYLPNNFPSYHGKAVTLCDCYHLFVHNNYLRD